MNPRERVPSDAAARILATLAEAGIEMQPVAAHRRLIVNETPGHDLAEFISQEYGIRILAVPENSVDAQIREQLAAREVPVPARVGREAGIELWLIPPGTQTIGSVAHLIADNPAKYGGLLRAAGEAHRRVYDSEIGGAAPIPGIAMCDRFAFAPDVHSSEGVGVYLIPPYAFDPNQPRDGFAHEIYDEFAAMDMFDPNDLLILGQQMQEGGGGI
jgi:hypothetical protein